MSSVLPSRTSRTPVEISASDVWRDDVRYAIDNGYECAKTIANHLGRAMHPFPDLSGLTIAELGTPDRFGPMLVCRAFGATVSVIHTHFVPWSQDFADLIRAIVEQGQREYPEANWSEIEPLAARGRYEPGLIDLIRTDYRTGDLSSIDEGRFDAIVTNAVLNQIIPIDAFMLELCRITRPDGFGIHQVDLRDSNDYAQPLEHLTVAESKVQSAIVKGTWTRGNRLRVHELARCFSNAGLRVDHFGPNMLADDATIARVRSRLAERFATMTDDQLRPISGRFYLRAITDSQIHEDVEYAVGIALEYVELIAGHLGAQTSVQSPLRGLRILELGPGRHFGTSLILSAFGARCAVLDKYLAQWDDVYHPRFYSFLLEALKAHDSERDWSSAEQVVSEQGHPESLIAQDGTDLAHPPSGFADGSFDVIVSNAVLEHVGDVPKTAREMARLTRPGGINIHQVDFRDHRGFDRPLEFLTVADNEYQKIFDESMNGNGNRVRAHWMVDMFADAGFDVDRFDPNIFAEADHMAHVRPRLQPQFSGLSDEELRVVSGRLFLTRRGAPRLQPPASDELAQRIERDVEYTLVNGSFYVTAIAARLGRPLLDGAPEENNGVDVLLPDLSGLRILELGPGTNFGTTLFCTGCGARIAVLDKYLAQWDPAYHAHLYRRVLEEVELRYPYADWSVLRAIVAAGRHVEDLVPSAVGDLAQPPMPYDDDSFDVVLSNAVLEHIGDTQAMARELARITAPGGIGIHQVDFRDHQAQSEPLTFLTLTEEVFRASFDEVNNTQGNRVRPAELAENFCDAGLTIDAFEPNLFVDEDHLAAMRPALQPRFAAMSDDQLRILSGRFYVRKSDLEPLASEFAQPRADEAAHMARETDRSTGTAQAQGEFTETINDQVGYGLRNAIDYAFHIGAAFGRRSGPIPDFSKIDRLDMIPDLSGLRLLELGPGRNFGSMLICQALGATIGILDKYIAAWDSSYHPRFYRSLRDAASRRLPTADWSQLDALIAAGRHLKEVVPQYECDLATPPSALADQSFDVILSNAVLEHVGDTYRTACELARLTAPNGLGIHQIDFRDHRDFDRPFDFLTIKEHAYQKLFANSRNQNGNRRRCHEWVGDFERAGFDMLQVEPNLDGDPAALKPIRPRIINRFAQMSDAQLLILSARVFVKRNDSPVPVDAFDAHSAKHSWLDRVLGRSSPPEHRAEQSP